MNHLLYLMFRCDRKFGFWEVFGASKNTQWLAEWKAWKDCVCLSLNEVLVFVLVLVLDVLQEMHPGVLLQRSGKVLVREEKRTSFSCFVFRKFYSVFSLCKSCWDEILDSFFTQDVSFSKGTSVQTRFF